MPFKELCIFGIVCLFFIYCNLNQELLVRGINK